MFLKEVTLEVHSGNAEFGSQPGGDTALPTALSEFYHARNSLVERGAIVRCSEDWASDESPLEVVWPAVPDLAKALPRVKFSVEEDRPQAALVVDPRSTNNDFEGKVATTINTPDVWRTMASLSRARSEVHRQCKSGPLGAVLADLIRDGDCLDNNQHPATRRDLAQRLVEFPVGVHELLPLLFRGVQIEEDIFVREDLMVAISKCGRAAVPGLVALMVTGEEEFSSSAAETLGNLGFEARDAALPFYLLQKNQDRKMLWEHGCGASTYFNTITISHYPAIERVYAWRVPESKKVEIEKLKERDSGVFYRKELEDLMLLIHNDIPKARSENRGLGEAVFVSAGMRECGLRILSYIAPRISLELRGFVAAFLAYELQYWDEFNDTERKFLKSSLSRLKLDVSCLDPFLASLD